MGQVPTLGTPVRRRKTTIKRGVKRNRRGTPNTREAPEKAPQILPRTKFSLLNSAYEEYLDGRHSYTKVQLFGLLSTNSLYWAHWSKVPCILDLA